MAASNPRYAEFHQILAAHPEWLIPWSGTLFRFQTINYPSPKDIVSGEGAKGAHRQNRLSVVEASKLAKLGVKLRA